MCPARESPPLALMKSWLGTLHQGAKISDHSGDLHTGAVLWVGNGKGLDALNGFERDFISPKRKSSISRWI